MCHLIILNVSLDVNLVLFPGMTKDLLSTEELVPKEVMILIIVLSLDLLLGQIMI
jgi:hypothetical protein